MKIPSISSAPRTIEDIFKDFSGWRPIIIRSLTHDVDEFYALCDPDKENLCLYGHTDFSWEVTLSAEEEVAPELLEPVLGINFARDGMNRKDWLSLVAVHSDSWLLSVVLYKGVRFNGNESNSLFLGCDPVVLQFQTFSCRWSSQVSKPNAQEVDILCNNPSSPCLSFSNRCLAKVCILSLRC